MILEEIRRIRNPQKKIRAWYDLVGNGRITDNPDAGDIDYVISLLLRSAR